MDIEIFYQKDADKYAQDCADIFDDNNKGFIVNKQGVFDNKKFNLLVGVVDNKAVCYQLIYIGGDFVKQEGYPEAYTQGLVYENDAVYIWDACTLKSYENKGLQKQLTRFLINKYSDKNLYSMTDTTNLNCVYMQQTLGFKPVATFVGHKKETYYILKQDKLN